MDLAERMRGSAGGDEAHEALRQLLSSFAAEAEEEEEGMRSRADDDHPHELNEDSK